MVGRTDEKDHWLLAEPSSIDNVKFLLEVLLLLLGEVLPVFDVVGHR